MPTIDCYLHREDGEFYDLGTNHGWAMSFRTFPGPPDGSLILNPSDLYTLTCRLDDNEALAADIIRWGAGKWIQFVTELDAIVPRDTPPSPITGSARAFVTDWRT
jgi:hypothetical protein